MALTFDDGPKPTTTDSILDILIAAGIKATFFVVGEMCEQYPDLLHRAIDSGMWVGVHSWSHENLTRHDVGFVRRDLERSIDLLRSVGVNPTVFRPPYGSWNDDVVGVAHSLGLRTVLWSVDGLDWKRPGTDVIIENVLSQTQDRSIILLHDGGPSDRMQTVAALAPVIEGLRDRGLTFSGL